MERRKFIRTSSLGMLGISLPALPKYSKLVSETRFGIADASYMLRRYRKMESRRYPPFTDALEMIAHCGAQGFGGMQVGVGGWDAPFSSMVKRKKEELDVFLEAQISMPKSRADIDRFDTEVKTAKATGIDVFRTVCLSGRRYEDFDTMSDFKSFRTSAIKSIQWAEPVMRKHGVKLAIENHKDWRTAELIAILRDLDSEYVGVTLDTGNNISLLENPMEVVEILAPYAFSVHLKDMAIREYEDGFLLSEVNLGTGFLDIDGIILKIREHRPGIRFNLEMITRDPLRIPCLTKKYWATLGEISAPELADYIGKVRTLKTNRPLPVVSNRTTDQKLALEEENNRVCLVYAKQKLGFN